jgi:hypothetical protein
LAAFASGSVLAAAFDIKDPIRKQPFAFLLRHRCFCVEDFGLPSMTPVQQDRNCRTEEIPGVNSDVRQSISVEVGYHAAHVAQTRRSDRHRHRRLEGSISFAQQDRGISTALARGGRNEESDNGCET